MINASGVMMGMELAAANVDERDLVPELFVGLEGIRVGDKGYALTVELAQQGLHWVSPLRSNMKQQLTSQYSNAISRCRQLAETVIAHLCCWFEIETVQSRDCWHLTSRLARKLLAHPVMVLLNLRHQRLPLQFDGIIRD